MERRDGNVWESRNGIFWERSLQLQKEEGFLVGLSCGFFSLPAVFSLFHLFHPSIQGIPGAKGAVITMAFFQLWNRFPIINAHPEQN